MRTGTWKTAVPPILPAMVRSPLMRKGGFDVLDGLVDAATLASLLREALASWSSALPQDDARRNRQERGGTPARRFASGAGGPVQEAFYQSPWVLGVLSQLAGVAVRPTGRRGTFTYYARAGDYLDLHRDIPGCDVAAITLLHDDGPPNGLSGCLCVYPGRCQEPLEEIRRTPERGAYAVRPSPGQTIVLLGGIVPHRVLRVGSGQRRIISVLCFEASWS